MPPKPSIQTDLCLADGDCSPGRLRMGLCSRHYKRMRTKGTTATPPRTIPIATRFWAKVDTDGECWEWTARRYPTGYGSFYHSPENPVAYAHRVSWELHFGPIPAEMWVCHLCDNPPCVRPDHLFLGSRQDNIADMWGKARGSRKGPGAGVLRGANHPYRRDPSLIRRGEQRPHKLTADEVETIRRLYAGGGFTHKALAAEFGVHKSTISKLTLGNSWQHLLNS